MTLTAKTRLNIGWAAADQFSFQGLTLGLGIILARLIDPSEFGLLAIVMVFVSLLGVFVNIGLSSSIIQLKNLDRKDVSTAFVINLTAAVILYLLVFATAPYVAAFYVEPRITLLLRVVSLTLVISGFSKCQQALISRQLQFKKLFFLKLFPFLVSATIGVSMALSGFEVWALVGNQLTQISLVAVSFWYFCTPELRPKFEFHSESFKKMFSFSSGVFGASLFYTFAQNVSGLVIGKAFAPEQLAFYNRAQSFPKRGGNALSSIFNRVLFPTFSKIQDDNERIVTVLSKGTKLLFVIVAPIMCFLCISAEPLVRLLLTEKWLPSVPLMRWTPVIGLIYPIASIQMAAIGAKGKGGLFFWMDVIKNSAGILILFVTLPFGLLAIVIGQAFVTVAQQIFVNSLVSSRLLGYSWTQQATDTIPYLFAASFAAVVASLVSKLWDSPPIQILLLQFVVLTTTYLVICSVFRFHGLRLALKEAQTVVGHLTNGTQNA